MYNEKTGNYVTPVGRASFPVLHEARQINNQGQPKFQLTLLFKPEAQKTKDFKDLEAAVEKAIKDKWGDNRPRKVKTPFMTTDDLKNKVPAGYEDEDVFIRLTSEIPAGIVVLQDDGSMRKLTDPAEIKRELYAGCDVKASVNVYAWKHDVGGAGVSFGLANVCKVAENEPFGATQAKPDDDFGGPVTGDEEAQDFMD